MKFFAAFAVILVIATIDVQESDGKSCAFALSAFIFVIVNTEFPNVFALDFA